MSSAPTRATNRPGPRLGTIIGSAASWRSVISSSTSSQLAKANRAKPNKPRPQLSRRPADDPRNNSYPPLGPHRPCSLVIFPASSKRSCLYVFAAMCSFGSATDEKAMRGSLSIFKRSRFNNFLTTISYKVAALQKSFFSNVDPKRLKNLVRVPRSALSPFCVVFLATRGRP